MNPLKAIAFVTSLTVIAFIGAGCENSQSPSRPYTPTVSVLAADKFTPGSPPTKTSPTQSPSPTDSQEVDANLAEFPLPPLTRKQILEVATCEIEGMADARYPESLDRGHLAGAFSPLTNCDWAVLAFAYASRNQKDVPDPAGVEALKYAGSGNYGFALATPLYYSYFGTIHVVNKIPAASEEITKVDISYDWWGLGDPPQVRYALSIDHASTDPVVITRLGAPLKNAPISRVLIQELSQGLSDLLPIDSRIQVVPCTDNYPTWSVTLYFADGSKLEMVSDSNVVGLGGPWETEIDGQVYIQYGADFGTKLDPLVQALGLQLGSPAAWTCFPDPVFEKAFSRLLPPTATRISNTSVDAMFTAVMETLSVQFTQEALRTPPP